MEEKLKNMSVGATVIMAILIGGAFYALYYDSGEKQQLKINQTRREIATKKTKITRADSQILAAKRYELIEKKMGEVMGRVLKYIPSNIKSFEVQRFIQKAATDSELNIVKIERRNGLPLVVKGAPFVKMPITTQLEGSFVQIMDFLSRLTKLNRIVTVDGMRFESKRRSNIIQFSATFMGYRYVDDGQVK